MRLQLAIDILSLDKSLKLVEECYDYIDIIEIGTPLIKYEGIKIVKEMKKNFPEKTLLVDLKTMDVGEYESDFIFDVGGDIVTVLALADDDTIKGSVKSAEKFNKEVVVDLINVRDVVKRVNEINNFADVYFSIHTGIDQQNRGETPLKNLSKLKEYNSKIFVAGGISLDTIDNILPYKPNTIVVGGAITGVENPKEIAKKIKDKISGVK